MCISYKKVFMTSFATLVVFALAVFFMLIGVAVSVAVGLLWFIDVFRK